MNQGYSKLIGGLIVVCVIGFIALIVIPLEREEEITSITKQTPKKIMVIQSYHPGAGSVVNKGIGFSKVMSQTDNVVHQSVFMDTKT